MRSGLIAYFLNWLFHSFSLVLRTLSFTILFFAGMIFLSWWDSTLPHIGDPIQGPANAHHETPEPCPLNFSIKSSSSPGSPSR